LTNRGTVLESAGYSTKVSTANGTEGYAHKRTDQQSMPFYKTSFPLHFPDRTTSVAWIIPLHNQPNYLIAKMSEYNKVMRLLYTLISRPATAVVLLLKLGEKKVCCAVPHK
jgi:hypothetical protein